MENKAYPKKKTWKIRANALSLSLSLF